MMCCVAALVGMFVNISLTSNEPNIISFAFSWSLMSMLDNFVIRSSVLLIFSYLFLYGASICASISASGPPMVFLVSTMGRIGWSLWILIVLYILGIIKCVLFNFPSTSSIFFAVKSFSVIILLLRSCLSVRSFHFVFSYVLMELVFSFMALMRCV